MRIAYRTIVVFILAVTVISCESNEQIEFSEIPFLEFRDIQLVDLPYEPGNDLLKLTFLLRDGDSNFGIFSELDSPFQFQNYFFKSNGKSITDEKRKNDNINYDLLLSYKDRKNAPYDTLPEFKHPYNCLNWELLYTNEGVYDTIYFSLNKYYYNLFVEFYTDNDGKKELYNFESEFPNCVASLFDFRVQNLINKNSDRLEIINYSSSESQVTYDIYFPFKIEFKGKKIFARIKVVDHALNESNEIQSTTVQF